MNKRTMTWITATTLWLVNPVFSGCYSSSDTEFNFGETDLLEILDDVNTHSWEITFDGELSTVTVDLTQMIEEIEINGDQASILSFIGFGSAHACDSRTFLAEAEACIDVSSLPIEGTLTVRSNLDIESEPQVFDVSGSLDVFGKTLEYADIWVRSDRIEANWNAEFNEEGQMVGIALGYIE